MDYRKQEEIAFHDMLRVDHFAQRWSLELEKIIKNNPLWVNMKYYSVERRSRFCTLNWLANHAKDKIVLDYCCGNGEDAIFTAKSRAKKVVGIDISSVSIDNCKKKALSEGVEKTTSFYVMDGERMEFDDNYFDIINEYGVLHHLDLQRAYLELARVLKSNGKIICTETLGHNPIIHLYRKRTPHLRTEWETVHILKKRHIFMAYHYFNKVEALGFFHLATLTAVPFRNIPFIFNPLLNVMEFMDSLILKLPLIKWQAWQVVFVLSNPKKAA